MSRAMEDHLSCVICLEYCTDAVETQCCSQLLCEKCSFSLSECPTCRHGEVQFVVSKIARRIIGDLEATCVCGHKTTRSELKSHTSTCPAVPRKCNQPDCPFSGPRDSFLSHIISAHSSEAFNIFTATWPAAYVPIRDCISRKGNSRLGETGKYYCGEQLASPCYCCDGYCGPESGCNCERCMLLDIEARALPEWYLVNSEGKTARPGLTGMWYCGCNVMRGMMGCDGWCGPSDGPQCESCERLQSQVNTRYRGISSKWHRK